MNVARCEEGQLVSIVAPAYNEEVNILPFMAALDEALKDRDFDIEIVFVNDGSRDRTLQVLKDLASSDSRVRVLSFSRNYGAVAAYTAGLNAVVGDAAVLMAVDLQDPPSLILDFVAAWRKGNDIVWAVRDSRQDPLMKSFLAQSFYWILRKIAIPTYPDGGADTGLFSRRVIDVFRSQPERSANLFFSLFTYGFRTALVPYRRRARERGKSGWSFWRRLDSAFDVICGYSYLPLRVISVTGIALSLFAVLYGIFIVGRRILFDLGGDGWTSLSAFILFIGGLQMLFLGVLSEYVWRIAEQVRRRPRYIVAEEFGSVQRTLPDLAVDPHNVNVAFHPGIATTGSQGGRRLVQLKEASAVTHLSQDSRP
jgi:dolichol-phosphate mannosyltransferase